MSKNGRLGARSETFDGGPPVIFLPQRRNLGYVRNRQYLMLRTLLDGMRHGPCSNHNFSRIGMGALRASFEAMFKAITGKELKTVAFGKPQLGTFHFATRLLQQWRKDTQGI